MGTEIPTASFDKPLNERYSALIQVLKSTEV
jgi:hypothetical protein